MITTTTTFSPKVSHPNASSSWLIAYNNSTHHHSNSSLPLLIVASSSSSKSFHNNSLSERRHDANNTKETLVVNNNTNNNDKDTATLSNRLDTLSPTVPCQRTCHHYHNKILLYFPYTAGLLDRLWLIHLMLQLAGYLCAQLYVPRPIFALNQNIHNRGYDPLEFRMTWNDFGTFTFVGNGNNMPRETTTVAALVDWIHPKRIRQPPQGFRDDPMYQQWLHVETRRGGKVWSDFERLEQFVFLQQQHLSEELQQQSSQQQSEQQQHPGFVWDMRAKYYEWANLLEQSFRDRLEQPPPLWFFNNQTIIKSDKINHSALLELQWRHMQPNIFSDHDPIHPLCQYATITEPEDMVTLKEQIISTIWQRHSNAAKTSLMNAFPLPHENASSVPVPPIVGFLHIRRSDCLDLCNSSLERIDSYLNCSLRQLLVAPPRHPPHAALLLLSSDERDVHYRRTVLEYIRDQHVTAIDLDDVVQTVVDQAIRNGTIPPWRRNNFYTFQCVVAIRYATQLIHFRLAQRPGACGDCTNVTSQLRGNHERAGVSRPSPAWLLACYRPMIPCELAEQ
jgi:hypothetical protein